MAKMNVVRIAKVSNVKGLIRQRDLISALSPRDILLDFNDFAPTDKWVRNLMAVSYIEQVAQGQGIDYPQIEEIAVAVEENLNANGWNAENLQRVVLEQISSNLGNI